MPILKKRTLAYDEIKSICKFVTTEDGITKLIKTAKGVFFMVY